MEDPDIYIYIYSTERRLFASLCSGATSDFVHFVSCQSFSIGAPLFLSFVVTLCKNVSVENVDDTRING